MHDVGTLGDPGDIREDTSSKICTRTPLTGHLAHDTVRVPIDALVLLGHAGITVCVGQTHSIEHGRGHCKLLAGTIVSRMDEGASSGHGGEFAMSLFGSIGHAFTSAATTVTHAATSTVHTVAHAATTAEHSVAHAATSTVHSTAHAVSSAEHTVAHAAGATAHAVGTAGAVAGKWAWHNKAEIGLWVGTTALMAAIPMTGGASGALAGGLLAARGATIAARVASAGRVGATAVRLASAGAEALRGASVVAKGASIARKSGTAIRGARLALGATKAGRAVAATSKPLMVASTALGGANVADDVIKLSRGHGSLKSLALDSVGLIPAGGALAKSAATRSAARAERAAASAVAERLPEVEASAAAARSSVIDAVQAANAADKGAAVTAAIAPIDSARATANVARARAATRLTEAVPNAPKSDPAALTRQLASVESSARSAITELSSNLPDAGRAAEQARQATQELEHARATSRELRHYVESAAAKTQRLERTADIAATTGDAAGTTAAGARIVDTASHLSSAQSGNHGNGTFGSDIFSLARTTLGLGLTRNAKGAVATAR